MRGRTGGPAPSSPRGLSILESRGVSAGGADGHHPEGREDHRDRQRAHRGDEEAFERYMLSGDMIGQTLDRLAAETETEAETEADAEIWIDENGAETTEAHATRAPPSGPIQISDTPNTADRDLRR